MRVLAWICGAVAVIWLAMSLTYPFGWDQGLFSWVGGAIVHGGMPYADAWDFKGPLVYYTYALAETLFGVHLWSIRILDAVLLIAATLSLRRAAESLTDAVTARWTALVFFLWYASQSFWHTAQPDGWAGMLLLIAITPLLSPAGEVRLLTLARTGLLIGLATLFKPLWAAFLLLPLAHLVITRSLRLVSRGAVVTAGWVLPIALTAAWFIARGAMDDLIAVYLRYSAMYAGLSPGDRARGLVEYLFASRVVAVALPVMAYGAVVLWQRRRPVAILLVSWVAIVVAAVALQNRFYAYHWVPLLPAATLLGAAGLHDMRDRLRPLALITCTVVVLHCLAPVVFEEMRFASWIAGRTSTEAYYDAYGEPGDDMKAVRWLRERGQPGPVFAFGWLSSVVWLSERQNVSRFGYSLPIMMGEGTDVRAQYRAELLAALAATPPRYILVGAQSERILGTRLTLADFPELADLLARGYTQAAQLGKITVYKSGR